MLIQHQHKTAKQLLTKNTTTFYYSSFKRKKPSVKAGGFLLFLPYGKCNYQNHIRIYRDNR